ncbi:MAG: oligosaccharide flippase family protein [Bacilli bacterium]|nr:oligosaccharide flippase family protein [Bacilli bacterium]
MKKTLNRNDTRTSNVIRNTWVGIITQFAVLLVSFVNRTVFINMLGNDYLSVNGLYSNIINALSFVELGFGTALIYMLYKPVADNDKKKTQVIIKFYKKTYSIIGSIMFILGILVIPFMKYIIKDAPNIPENLNFIYILFLISTCTGYFFAHNTAIINANQKNYLISLYNQLGKFIQGIIQIVFLIITKNYIIYLLIQIIMTLISNILISLKARRLYSYIYEKNIPDLDKKDKNIIKSKVKSLILYRIGPSILNGSDNLILSACVGLSYVGIYSNYYLITNYLNLFLNQITSSLETSIGNLNASNEVEHKEFVFYKILYLCFIIYGTISILLMALMNDFIYIWLGEEYLFSTFIVFTIVLYNYANGMHFACCSYRTTAALFDKSKYVPVYEAILNIGISIILAKYLGVAGVFLGTTISKFLTFSWTDPVIIYKYLFKNKNVCKYFKKYLYYLFITLLIGGVTTYISSLIIVTNYFAWFIKSCMIGIFVILLIILFTFKMVEYKEIKYIFLEYLDKLKRKIIKVRS